MELSIEIQQLRAQLGLTQREAAAKWGVSFGSVRTWEQSKNKPDKLKMERIRQIIADLLAAKPASLPLASQGSPADAPAAAKRPRKSKSPPKPKRRRRPA